ncbi:MAG: insulinase family protein [bacterium]|jgi:zinc protease
MVKNLPVKAYSLKSGLKVYTFDVPESARCYVDLWFCVGAECERPEQFGISHFLEHMVFKGNEKYGAGDIDRLTAEAGGYNNAATALKYTHYHFVMPHESLPVALDLLFEMCARPSIDRHEFDLERQVVMEEMKQYRDHPLLAPYLLHQLGFYADTPWGHNILGTEDSLNGLTAEAMKKYHRSHYTPGNAALIVSGKLPDERKLLELVEMRTEGWGKSRLASNSRRRLPNRLPAGEHRLVYPADQEVAYGYLSVPCPGGDVSGDGAILSLLTFLLAGTFSSRLNQALMEKELLCQEFELASEDTPPANSLLFRFVTESTEKVPRILEVYREHLQEIAAHPPSWDELSTAKAAISAQRKFGSEDAVGAGAWLGVVAFPRRSLAQIDAFLDLFDRAVPEDISSLASRILADMNRVGITIAYPGTQKEPSVPQNLGKFLSPAVRRVFVEKSLGKKSSMYPERIGKTDSGIEVFGWHVPVSSTVSFRLDFPYDLTCEPSAGISRITNELLLKGTKRKSAIEISKLFERVGASIDVSFSSTHLGLSTSLVSGDWAIAPAVFAEILGSPRFDSKELERARWDSLTKLARIKDENSSYAWDRFCRSFFKSSPYGVQSLGNENDLMALKARTVMAYAKRIINPETCRVVVTGSFDSARVMDQLESEFAKYKFSSKEKINPREGTFKGGNRRLSFKMDKEQSALLVGMPAAGISSPESVYWQLFNCILGVGANSRLFRILRGRESLAYSVGSSYFAGKKLACIAILILTSFDKVEAAWQGIIREISNLVSKPPTKREFKAAQRFLSVLQRDLLETPHGKCSEIMRALQLGMPPDYPLTRIDELLAADYGRFCDFVKNVKMENWGAIHVGRSGWPPQT